MWHRLIHQNKGRPWVFLAVWAGMAQLALPAEPPVQAQPTSALLHIITLNPGHFHAALFQKETLPGVSDTVHVYAPLGPDLLLYLQRVAQFNNRIQRPTHWKLEVHASPDYLSRLVAERAGNVVVISGRNQGKIDQIHQLLAAGFHVLADKPWVIEPEDLPKLAAALDTAAARQVIAFDAMTQRFEISCLLQKALVNDSALFGQCLPGSPDNPAVRMESVHYLLKEVAGVPSRRPGWFFDVQQQGEGLSDVGTHLVDLVQWTLFPAQAIRYQQEIEVVDGTHWPTTLTREQFQRVTGESDIPETLAGGSPPSLRYYANNSVLYTLRGIHVALTVRWDFTPERGASDSETAVYRGSRSRVEVQQGREQEFKGELYVIPNDRTDMPQVREALEQRLRILQESYPGLSFEQDASRLHVLIPDAYRVGHEQHFALLTQQFLEYVRAPASLPSWEKLNMLAKYYVTTRGVQLARAHSELSSPLTPKK